MLRIQVNTAEVEKLFKDIGDKLPKVMADTANVLGGMVQAETIKEMRTKFKGGTSGWVLNSFGLQKATASNPIATVKYNRGRHFMQIQVDGGKRPAKGAESLLRGKGVMLADQAYLPGPGATKDQYGNLSPGIRSKVLSYFKTYTGTNSRNNRQGATNRKGDSFFAIKQQRAGLAPGVYQRVQDASTLHRLNVNKALILNQTNKIDMKGKKGRSRDIVKSINAMRVARRKALLTELRLYASSKLPRGIKMVMAFDTIKAYTPLIKFYEIANKIVFFKSASTFRKVAEIELGKRLQW